MNLNFFIARRIGGKRSSGGKLGKISTIIATASVGISIAIMILAIAIANGFRKEVKEKASGFNGDITLSSPGVEIVNHLYPIEPLSFIDKIDSLPQVKGVYPVAYRTALLKNDSQIQGVIFKGVGSGYDMEFFGKYLEDGELPDYTVGQDSSSIGAVPSDYILLSRRLASIMDYHVGDKIMAYFVDETVKMRRFTIKGIFNAQLDELDKSLVIADIRHISNVNGWKNGELSGYELALEEKGSGVLDDCAVAIEQILYDNTKESDASVVATTLEERFFVLFDWLHLLDMNVLVILFLMVAVAGFNMISGLLIMLFESISQIGLLKALGMTDRSVAKIFLIRASYIVLRGLLAGSALSMLFCWLQWKYRLISLDPANYFVPYVPIDMDLYTVAAINVISFLLIMLILVVPCKIISRVSPSRTIAVE